MSSGAQRAEGRSEIGKTWDRYGRPLVRGALAVALAAAAFLLGRASRPPASTPHQVGPAAHGAAGNGGEVRLYTCSMHPQVRSTDPREKCPLCGMDLIPVPSEGDTGEQPPLPRLTLSPRAAALLQVVTAPVARRQVRTTLLLPGALVVDETRVRQISAWVAGRLERLLVDQTGVEVRAGQPLVEVYSPTLVAAQEELLQAQAALDRLPASASPSQRASAAALLAASRDKLRLLGLSAAQVEEVVERGEVIDRVMVTAPAGGVVLARDATVGAMVQAGDRLYSLAELDQLWAVLEAHEDEVGWLKVGHEVSLTVASWPGEKWGGRVAFLAPRVDEERRTVGVRVEVPNPGRRLKPGMLVTGEVRPPVATEAVLVIPASAPLRTGRRAVVYVQVPDAPAPTFVAREVELGPRAGEEVVVRAGLAEGEVVVARGAFKLDSELQIRGRPSMMAAGGLGESGGGGADPTAPSPAPSFAVPPSFAAALAGLVEENFSLVKGLADDDPAAAGAAAQRLGEKLGQLDGSVLPPPARAVWEPLSGQLRQSLEALRKGSDLAAMRRPFETFSDALTEAVRRFGVGSPRPIYRAMCPMVQGRKAYWLQPQRAITNPYHGAAMYACGEIVEELGAAGAPAGGKR